MLVERRRCPCGATFEKPHKVGRWPRFCSDECRRAAGLKIARAQPRLGTDTCLGRPGTPLERFLIKVRKLDNGCWLWIGARQAKGYGIFGDGGKTWRAHRWSYDHHRGPIPEGLTLDHLCQNRSCVNPAHLEPVTRDENIRRYHDARVAA